MAKAKQPIINKNIGYYLRVYRAERNLSQKAAARLFKLSPSHWSLMEAGKRNASPDVAFQLASVTGGPVHLFLGVKG